jgi:hypothetical protein
MARRRPHPPRSRPARDERSVGHPAFLNDPPALNAGKAVVVPMGRNGRRAVFELQIVMSELSFGARYVAAMAKCGGR